MVSHAIMRSEHPSFISITDFTSREQVVRLLRKFASGLFLANRSECPQHDVRLGVGVMMSRKTLLGLPAKWASVFPRKEDVHSIFLKNPNVFNALHYVDYEGESGESLFENLRKAILYGGPNLDALQLDMIWPDKNVLQQIKSLFPGVKIILQIGREAVAEAGTQAESVALKIHEDYIGRADYLLLDMSGGKGIQMDPAYLDTLAMTIHRKTGFSNFVFAGGLGPDTVWSVNECLTSVGTPTLPSIDAQSRLRPSRDAMDPIDWEMADLYIGKALGMYAEATLKRDSQMIESSREKMISILVSLDKAPENLLKYAKGGYPEEEVEAFAVELEHLLVSTIPHHMELPTIRKEFTYQVRSLAKRLRDIQPQVAHILDYSGTVANLDA